MTWGTLQTVVVGVVVLLVVLVAFVGLIPGLGTPVIEAARDQLNIGNPAVASFDIKPIKPLEYKDGKLDVELDFTLRKANVNKIKYVNVEKTSYASNDIPPAAATASSGNVHKDPIKDFDSLQKSIPLEGSEGLVPGWYDFAVKITTKDGTSVTPAEKSFKFFDEDYLEMFNGRVEGCPPGSNARAFGLDLKGCNVVECKKADFQDMQRLADDAKLSQGSFCYDAVLIVLKQVSADFRKENGIPDSSSCGSFLSQGLSQEYSSTKVDLSACSPEQVDSFNKMSARVWLMLFACGSSVKGEQDYAKLSSAELDSLMQQAVKRTSACVEGYGDVAGLKGRLVSQGFAGFGNFNREGEVEAEVGNVLKNLRTRISGLVSEITSNRALMFSWKLLIGGNAVEGYNAEVLYAKTPPDKAPASNEDLRGFLNRKKIPFEVVSSRQLSKSALSASYPEAGGLSADGNGGYWFVLRAYDKQGESDVKYAFTGIYDDSFIELYRDLKGVDDACGDDCNVIGKKENVVNGVFGLNYRPDSEITYTEAAYELNRDKFQASCALEARSRSGAKTISGCTESEIDIIYNAVVTDWASTKGAAELKSAGKTVFDLLKTGCGSEEWMRSSSSYEYTVWHVCMAKAKLIGKLNKLNWINVK